MPAAQLFTSVLETAINRLLPLDEDIASKLAPLKGKQLQVHLSELPWPLRFVFSDKVDVLVITDSSDMGYDCAIGLSLATVKELQDKSQITRLIKQNLLTLDGDLDVAQAASDLAKTLHIDWEEHLSRFIGDVPAHKLFQLGSQVKAHFQQRTDLLRQILSEGAIEEKRIAAPAIAVADFCDQVNDVRSHAERLEARLNRLQAHIKE